MSEGTQPGRYCRNCGTEIRPGMTFCVSCGAPVTPVAGGPGPSSPGFDLPGRLRSFLGDLRSNLRQSREGLGGTFSGFGTDGIRRLPGKTMEWFRGLSGVPKLVLVGLVVLVLLVLLSPVVALVAALLVGVSIIALMIRVAQKGSLKNWGLVAVGSVVLMFTFGGISGALYGIGFGGEKDVAYDVVSEDEGTDGDSQVYNVVSTSNDLESLNLVAQEIQQERLQQNSGTVIFYKSRADVPNSDPVGVASIFLDEMQVRANYADDALSLSSEEVEQMVDLLADNGYVMTSLSYIEGGETGGILPEMPDFMMEDRDTASASPTSAASPSASPSASPDSDQVSITGEIFGYPETFTYDGLTVTGTVVDWNGDHIMVIQDPMQGVGVILGTPGQQVTVHGEYQGTITTSDGGTYEAVMAEEVE